MDCVIFNGLCGTLWTEEPLAGVMHVSKCLAVDAVTGSTHQGWTNGFHQRVEVSADKISVSQSNTPEDEVHVLLLECSSWLSFVPSSVFSPVFLPTSSTQPAQVFRRRNMSCWCQWVWMKKKRTNQLENTRNNQEILASINLNSSGGLLMPLVCYFALVVLMN